jgi:predicted glycosyltransferase
VKILLDIGHPKDVNVFKNVIIALQNHGHEIKIVSRAKENTKQMLNEYGFEYEECKYHEHLIGKAFGIITNDIQLYKIAKKFKPDVFVSPGSPYSAHVSQLLGKPHIAFSDTEIAGLVIKLMLPFTDKIYTSSSFYLDLGPKQVRFNSYYELAYLHPKYFTPNKEVLKKYGLDGDYIILRLSALASHHDVGANGFSFETEDELKDYISTLEKYWRVIISSETDHWSTIADYQLKFDHKDLHDILYFAKLYIGEGATMASESAILGVPAIYVSNTRRGYLDELEKTYGLAFTIMDKQDALEKAIELLQDEGSTKSWKEKRELLLDDKIDVVEFMVDVIGQNMSN